MGKEKKSLDGWSQLRRSVREMREGTYLANAQARKRASRTPWDALGFLIAIPIFCVLWWGGVRLEIALVHAFRPSVPDAAIGFGPGQTTLAGIIFLLAPILTSISIALLLGNAFVHSIPAARRAQALKSGGMAYAEAQSGLAVAALLGFAIYVVLVLITILLA